MAGDADPPGPPPVPVDQLPDLAESHDWAHVQSIAAPSDVVTELAARARARSIARLVCPRRLAAGHPLPGRLVRRVRGRRRAAPARLERRHVEPPTLTVFDTWTFTTGEAGSFEELCRRLGPVADAATCSSVLHTIDVTELGAIERGRPGRSG